MPRAPYSIGQLLLWRGRFIRLAQVFSDGSYGADVVATPTSKVTVLWVEVTATDLAAGHGQPAAPGSP